MGSITAYSWPYTLLGDEMELTRVNHVANEVYSAMWPRYLSSVVGSVVMLNLLIAIMSDTYERVCSADLDLTDRLRLHWS